MYSVCSLSLQEGVETREVASRLKSMDTVDQRNKTNVMKFTELLASVFCTFVEASIYT